MAVLTSEEKALIRRAFMLGPSAFAEAGLYGKALIAFKRRPDVHEEFSTLIREYSHQDVLASATRFGLTRQLARLGDGAVAMLAQGMAGPAYARDNEGHILIDARGNPVLDDVGLSPVQLRSAEGILDRLGVDGTRKDKPISADVDVLLRQMDEAAVKIEDDPQYEKDEQRALSRERVRTVIEVLSSSIPDARKRLLKSLGLEEPKKKKKVTPRARPRKKKKKARRRT